ncbi:MAG: prepilin-type N-terminal cleavage/methylation domain-containing protein [Phycisphaerales bacterium]|nr:carbohydrate binding domain-containing protein [Phycisphaerae bacterium]NNF41962.1 prepilin-type N-terminal cleavage/methylation domain-containing protein [Phycisphaerales bacterium]NNM24501.1 prepilin-type N-terminal cleavage/methylation domain-containing protein [Phycisphaerales bacterium]
MQRTRPTDRQPATDRRGFTLIEATISIALVGLVMVGAMELAGASVRVRHIGKERPRGIHLARDLMEEIIQTAYADPDAPPNFGREGEPPGDRSKWNDVDDYAGVTDSPPTDLAGDPIDGYAGWSRSVVVNWVATDKTHETRGTETGLKKITVTATDPAGHTVSISTLRAERGVLDTQLPYGRTFAGRLETSIQIGDTSTRMRSATTLLNRPDGEHNLLVNSGFESGTASWFPTSCVLSESGSAHGGLASGRLQSRMTSASDVGQSILGKIERNQTYRVSGWAKTTSGSEGVTIAMHVDATGDASSNVFVTDATTIGSSWTFVSGTLTPSWSGTITGASLRISTWPGGGTKDLFLDDLHLSEEP